MIRHSQHTQGEINEGKLKAFVDPNSRAKSDALFSDAYAVKTSGAPSNQNGSQDVDNERDIGDKKGA